MATLHKSSVSTSSPARANSAGRAPRIATRNDLSESVRTKVITVLQARLADAIDLAADVKQAHWNVKGPQFIALHQMFDDLHGVLTAQVDEVAERIVALGGLAQGTVHAAARASSLKEYPAGIVNGTDHVHAVADRLADYGAKMRAAIDATDKAGDANSADLCTAASRDIDKWLWFVEAHAQTKA
jgi:starvation-inducible DNA-binding protein